MENQKCSYPNCVQPIKKTWGLVPLCALHYSLIEEETHKYYHRNSHERIKYEQREKFLKIADKIPWCRKVWGY